MLEKFEYFDLFFAFWGHSAIIFSHKSIGLLDDIIIKIWKKIAIKSIFLPIKMLFGKFPRRKLYLIRPSTFPNLCPYKVWSSQFDYIVKFTYYGLEKKKNPTMVYTGQFDYIVLFTYYGLEKKKNPTMVYTDFYLLVDFTTLSPRNIFSSVMV